MSHAEFLAYTARRVANMVRSPLHDSVERESDLHNEILAECKRRQWICLHSRMDSATGRTIGEPDFVILRDGGQVLLVEAKSKLGKLSNEQRALHAWSSSLGHEVFTVRSFREFLEIL